MNFSELKPLVYSYLSKGNADPNPQIDALAEEYLDKLEKGECFRAISAEYTLPLDFLKKEPYTAFLKGGTGYFLLACTLSHEIDRKIRRLSVTDMAKAVILDACASAYLEYAANKYKNTLHAEASYIFCPGYAGSSASDMKYIFNELKPQKIGMALTESSMLIPQKSMAGIVCVGATPEITCGGCVKKSDCEYRKEGKKCYQ